MPEPQRPSPAGRPPAATAVPTNIPRFVQNWWFTRPGAPWVLDLFCGPGGAAMGYWQAGFNVVGVDIAPQPHYPFWFMRADALEFARAYGQAFDLIHASPPCQRYSVMTKRWERQAEHPDLIAPVRHILSALKVPYVIENVPGAPVNTTIVLCGSMFGLPIRKHRLFETSTLVLQPVCQHQKQDRLVGIYGHSGGTSNRDQKGFAGIDDWRSAMQIDWTTRDELTEAIPPAYTRYIGAQMMRVVRREPVIPDRTWQAEWYATLERVIGAVRGQPWSTL